MAKDLHVFTKDSVVHVFNEPSGRLVQALLRQEFQAVNYCEDKPEYSSDIVCDFCQETFFDNKFANSIFDKINKNDIVFVRFPNDCFQVKSRQKLSGWEIKKHRRFIADKIEDAQQAIDKLKADYDLLLGLVKVANRHKFPMIIEVEVSGNPFLQMYFPIRRSLYLADRKDVGDLLSGTSAFYFINCRPYYTSGELGSLLFNVDMKSAPIVKQPNQFSSILYWNWIVINLFKHTIWYDEDNINKEGKQNAKKSKVSKSTTTTTGRNENEGGAKKVLHRVRTRKSE